ncbi:MAG: DUF4835 family protein [Flavobacteriales bacterium]|nr:DUF4835 family protein [Flavobacteriales bacterium]
MKKGISIFLFAISISLGIHAQELNCDVSIIKPQIMIGDEAIFETMENSIEEFINGRKWTEDDFRLEERIECTMQITIETWVNQRQFKGAIQVGSSRPVYHSDYKTPLVSINDRDLEFIFQENSLLQWSSDQHRDNLSSVLAFYAHYLIGLDYDTFSMEGGTPYFLLCQTVVANAQNSPEPGWKSNEKSQQNRYWLVENILSQSFKPLRECMYNYHRQGYDKLYSDFAKSRIAIADALVALRSVHKIRPSSYNMQVFFYAKSDEIVQLFKPTAVAEKQRVYDLVKQVDPGNISKYEGMMD